MLLKNFFHQSASAMDIPEDVVNLILVRLPVQSQLRFRCVCKVWRDLIGSRHFIDMHLRQGCPTKYLIVKRFDIAKDESTMLSYYSRGEDNESLRQQATPDWPEFPTFTTFSGACNGIILVCAHDPSETMVENQNPLYLCNPATRELRKIPDRPFGKLSTPGRFWNYNNCKRVGAGFGYDHRTNEYKVVSIMYFIVNFGVYEDYHCPGHDGVLKIEIYDVSSNTWRVADTIFPTVDMIHPDPNIGKYSIDLDINGEEMFPQFLCGLFINGSIHWVPYWDQVILAFNISDEVMRAFRLPRGIIANKNLTNHSHIFSMEDSLAFVQAVDDVEAGYLFLTYFYVWVMEEYGDEESWIRKFYLQPGIHMDVLAVWDDMLICETEMGELASCNLQEDVPKFKEHHHINNHHITKYPPIEYSYKNPPAFFHPFPHWKRMTAMVMHKESLVRLRCDAL